VFEISCQAAAVIVVVAGLAAGASMYLKQDRSSPRQPATSVIPAKAINAHVRGFPGAPIALVEYGDYECPPCNSYQYQSSIDRLLMKYPETIRYEFRHFPLTKIHPNALTAAMAAEAAGAQGKFWEMHSLLRTNYKKWARNPDARLMFIEMASQLGLDAKLFKQSFESPEIERAILQQEELGRDAGIEATPTFLINGRKLDQPPTTFEGFDALVMDMLKALKLEQSRPLK
jgi:protein-disulfide isomerase